MGAQGIAAMGSPLNRFGRDEGVRFPRSRSSLEPRCTDFLSFKQDDSYRHVPEGPAYKNYVPQSRMTRNRPKIKREKPEKLDTLDIQYMNWRLGRMAHVAEVVRRERLAQSDEEE